MAAFEEIQFPPSISAGATGGPQYLTDIVVLSSGFEKRNSVWANGRGSWDVATGVKNKAHLDTLIAFFRARNGRAQGFRFKDWADYQATGQTTAVIDSTHFQLQKTYTSGSTSYVRKITKPVSGTIAVYVSAVLKTLGVDYTVDLTTGILTFGSHPAATPTADFQFDVPARFDTDSMQVNIEALDSNSGAIGGWGRVPVVEIRV